MTATTVFLCDEQDLDVDGEDLVALARHVLAARDVPVGMEVTLLLVDEDTMAELNSTHMGAVGPTDVLAFPIDDPDDAPAFPVDDPDDAPASHDPDDAPAFPVDDPDGAPASHDPDDARAFPVDDPDGPGHPDGPVESAGPVPAILGDVVLCPAVATRQAREHGKRAQQELRLLTTHGILHLLGMDHAEPDEEREMFALTDELLADYDRAVAP